MHESQDSGEIHAYFNEQMEKLARANYAGEVARELPELSDAIRSTHLGSAAAIVGGLMTEPLLQPNHARLEMLAHLIVMQATGEARPRGEELNEWLNVCLAGSFVRNLEDPVDDVFVSNVVTRRGNRRIFNGTWETPDSWLQDLIDVLEGAPAIPAVEQLLAEVDALLMLSEAVAARTGSARFCTSGGSAGTAIPIGHMGDPEKLAARVVFIPADLEELGVRPDQLRPFIFDVGARARLATQSIQSSEMQRRPLLSEAGQFVLVLPAAISVALRMHILESMLQDRRTWSAFTQSLRTNQTARLFSEVLPHARPFDDVSQLLPKEGIDSKWIAELALRFDEGKYLHLVLLHDDYRDALDLGLASCKKPPDVFLEKLASHLAACAKTFASSEDFCSGLTVVVLAGIGRSFCLMGPEMPPGWHFTVWPLPDICALAWCENEWPIALWKLLNQVTEVQRRGITIDSEGDDVALYAYWLHNNYRLIPRECAIAGGHVNISVFCGFKEFLRHKFRRSLDEHAVFASEEGAWIRVRKTVVKGYFKEDEALPIYGGLLDIARGKLRGLVETDRLAFWLECEAPTSDRLDRDFLLQLWDAALHWVARIAPYLEAVPGLPGSPIVHLDLSSLDLSAARGGAVQHPGSLVDVTDVKPLEKTIVIKILGPFVDSLQRPENSAEHALVRKFVEAFLALARAQDAELQEAIVNQAMPGDDARYLHVFPHPQDIRDEIPFEDHPSARLVEKPDATFAPIGLAWEVMPPHAEGLTISTQDEANQFLNRVVDCIWDRIRAVLQKLDRRELIRMALCNHEAVVQDRERWRRTSRAVVALAQDREQAVATCREHEWGVNRAALASRVLAEMAICECPIIGGRRPGRTDIDALMADVAGLIGVAYDSDAVASGLVDPTVKVFPSGEFQPIGTFRDTILAPYQHGYFGELLRRNIEGYFALYELPVRGKPVEEVCSADFLQAFEQEYGLPLRQLVRAGEALEQCAVERGSFVVELSRSEAMGVLAAHATLTPAQIDTFVTHFCLTHRDRWDSAPSGFTARDWYPWRFRRRLSMMSRPLLLLPASGGDRLMYAPGLLTDAFALLVGDAVEGELDVDFFQSAAMRKWIGKVTNERGHAFNNLVAEEFRKCGYRARASVNMTEFGVPSEQGDMGDVDVIAWGPGGCVYVAECKNLRFARTVGEIVDQLKRFRGEANDELNKHLRRCHWLQDNTNKVASVLGMDPASVKLRPLLVTNTIVPMQFVAGLPLPAQDIMPLKSLANRLRTDRERA